jgi:hypothetical protein
MAEVYFSDNLDKILNKIDFSKLGKNVAIKVHFGEKGCETYLSPLHVKKVYDKIISLGKKATLVECNVLYRGSRTNAKDHIETAISHGFDFAPIDILDGELGNEDIEVNIKNGLVKKIRLGKGLLKYDSMIVLTHFKGHVAAGYGGAFKNIGMGLGSRAGKLNMHANVSPFVDLDKCISCGECIKNCPVKAISYEYGKAKINSEICIGCAMCIAVCPTKAVRIPWGSSTNEELSKKIVDYSEAVLKIIPNIMYINFLINITKDCDCMNTKQEPIMNDVGILYSRDIVAIDKASLDLAEKKSNGDFDKINNIDKSVQVDYANKKRLGEKNYELINLK